MTSTSQIWFAFARTFTVLFLVLALLVLIFYLIKKFSAARGIGGVANHINVISMHHLSPKEKLVLVDVLGEKILIGVTPSMISNLASFDSDIKLPEKPQPATLNFAGFLKQRLKGEPIRFSNTGQQTGGSK